MPPLLIYFIGAIVFLAFCALASQVYTRVMPKPPVEAEQELVGVGPESTKVDGEPKVFQG